MDRPVALDPLELRDRLVDGAIRVSPVEGLRRRECEVELVEAGLGEALGSFLVEDEPGVGHAVAAFDAGRHLLGSRHLRHPLGTDEADRFDLGKPARGKAVDQLRAHLRLEGRTLVLEAVARPDVADGDARCHDPRP